ncbi:extensin family protein [Hyphomicrobium sp.]|uniref:extensin-like domain-containing protein n=1 Tax=Hyphomicrobium sp. TaxID=82 RepID=UPI0025B82500|nr:extensin family protein [Hyphomicrobium sp.]MCC7253503.1 extensin family protein [Hyphomicrobium sp.]
MSLRNAPVMRLGCAVVALLPVLGATAHAQGLPDAVTDAFETIVIDATKAASKATAAAKDALAPEARKAKRKAKKKKDDAPEPEAASETSRKSGEKPADKTAPAKDTKDQDATDKKSAKAPAGKDAPPEPAAKAADGKDEADPKSGKAAETAKKPPGPPTEWPAVEVELARARCTQLLKDVDAVTIPEPPFRKGDCGSMAPVRLISIGKSPEISLSPPPVVSCDMVVALTKWMKEDVQPAAKRHLGAEVIRVESMSDYSCRMAYGRVGNKLSEHGKANALDIRGFITRKGNQAVVLDHWGETRRDVLRQLVAAKAAEKEKAEREKAEKEKAAAGKAVAGKADGPTTVTVLPRKTIAEGLAKDGNKSLAVPASVTKDGALDAKPGKSGRTKDAVLQMDGKKKDKGKRRSREEAALLAALPPEEAAKVKAPGPKTATARFLHDVHAAGCRIFGTTLGPEANEAHRNHFHVDMAERKYKKICD